MRSEMDYGGLVQSMLSPYIEKALAGRETVAPRPTAVRLIAAPDIHDRDETRAFVAGVLELGFEVKRRLPRPPTCRSGSSPIARGSRTARHGRRRGGRVRTPVDGS
ncbi:MAG: hypothetical protein R3E51_08495 [Rhizobiaceae bacterium]